MIHFRIGQKVVCISRSQDWNDPLYPKWGFHFPIVGGVYTIRDKEPPYDGDEGASVRVEEIINPPYHWTGLGEPNFRASRFRPVIETDISIFTAMLVPSPKETVNV